MVEEELILKEGEADTGQVEGLMKIRKERTWLEYKSVKSMRNTVEVPDGSTLNDSVFLLLVYIQRKLSQYANEASALPCLSQQSSQEPRHGNNCFYQLTNEQKRTLFTYTGNII